MPTLVAVPSDRTNRGKHTMTSHDTPDNTTHVPHTQDTTPNTGDVTEHQTPAIVRPLASTTRPGGNMPDDTTTTTTTNGGEGGTLGGDGRLLLDSLNRRLACTEALGTVGARLGRPDHNYGAIADGPGLELIEGLTELLARVARSLAYRDECNALAADGHKIPEPPADVATGAQLDELLRRAEAAALLGCCRDTAA